MSVHTHVIEDKHTSTYFMVYVVFQVGVVHISDGSKLYLLPTSPLTQELGEPCRGTKLQPPARAQERMWTCYTGHSVLNLRSFCHVGERPGYATSLTLSSLPPSVEVWERVMWEQYNVYYPNALVYQGQPRSQSSPAFVLWFVFSIIHVHGSKRAEKKSGEGLGTLIM